MIIMLVGSRSLLATFFHILSICVDPNSNESDAVVPASVGGGPLALQVPQI